MAASHNHHGPAHSHADTDTLKTAVGRQIVLVANGHPASIHSSPLDVWESSHVLGIHLIHSIV